MTKPDLIKAYKGDGYNKNTFFNMPEKTRDAIVELKYTGRNIPQTRK
jgi:hypothetical protein